MSSWYSVEFMHSDVHSSDFFAMHADHTSNKDVYGTCNEASDQNTTKNFSPLLEDPNCNVTAMQ